MTISTETFLIDYDINQFNCCLSASTVKNSLASITGKVDEENYLSVVLSKLREVSDAGLTPIQRTDVNKSAMLGDDTCSQRKTLEINETSDVVMVSAQAKIYFNFFISGGRRTPIFY